MEIYTPKPQDLFNNGSTNNTAKQRRHHKSWLCLTDESLMSPDIAGLRFQDNGLYLIARIDTKYEKIAVDSADTWTR